MSIRCSGTNAPSCSTIGAPHDHGPSSTFQSDFAQPVPAVHHTRSSRLARRTSIAACMRFAHVKRDRVHDALGILRRPARVDDVAPVVGCVVGSPSHGFALATQRIGGDPAVALAAGQQPRRAASARRRASRRTRPRWWRARRRSSRRCGWRGTADPSRAAVRRSEPRPRRCAAARSCRTATPGIFGSTTTTRSPLLHARRRAAPPPSASTRRRSARTCSRAARRPHRRTAGRAGPRARARRRRRARN